MTRDFCWTPARLLGVALLVTTSGYGNADTIDGVAEMLARLPSLEPQRPVSYDIEVNAAYTGMAAHGDEQLRMQWVSYMRRDGDRIDIMTSHFSGTQEPESRSPRYRSRAIWDGEMYTQQHRSPDASVETGAYVFSTEEDARNQVIHRPYVAPFQRGQLYQDRAGVVDLLKQAGPDAVSAREAELNGRNAIILSALIDGRRYTVWVDPGQNYRPMRIRKEGTFSGRDGTGSHDLVVDLQIHDVHEHEGALVITNAREVVQVLQNGEEISREEKTVTVSDIQWYDSFEHDPDAFVMDFPPDARIRQRGFPNVVEFEWRNGQPVPAFDADVVAAIDAAMENEGQGNEGQHVPENSVPQGPQPNSRQASSDTNADRERVTWRAWLLWSVLGLAVVIAVPTAWRINRRRFRP